MAEIGFDRVSKVFPDGTVAVSELTLSIGDGEFMVLVGPSGCGKTTALRMVAGLEEITNGELRIGGRVINGVPPKGRDIAMVFQDYALYPQMTVYDNMAFALKIRKTPKGEIRRRVEDAARILHLEGLLERRPRALSGGQRQRVAMGRAIVREPQAFLMDEPLSNLDAKLRIQMRAEISRIQRALGVTTIYVTHDQTEAMTMGDRVAVLNKGVLQQVAPPEEIYERPANLFTAGFIGAPAMNMLAAELYRTEQGLFARLGDQRIRCGDELSRRPGLSSYVGGSVILGLRPEHMEDAAIKAGPPDQRLSAVVDLREALGSEVLLFLSLDGSGIRDAPATATLTDGIGADEEEAFDRAAVVARASAESKARAGDRIEVSVDVSKLHFFDPETGDAIQTDRS
jgi:multiple sugar transport system ATP-binding protein